MRLSRGRVWEYIESLSLNTERSKRYMKLSAIAELV